MLRQIVGSKARIALASLAIVALGAGAVALGRYLDSVGHAEQAGTRRSPQRVPATSPRPTCCSALSNAFTRRRVPASS
jgi:hypothetical protein